MLAVAPPSSVPTWLAIGLLVTGLPTLVAVWVARRRARIAGARRLLIRPCIRFGGTEGEFVDSGDSCVDLGDAVRRADSECDYLGTASRRTVSASSSISASSSFFVMSACYPLCVAISPLLAHG